MTMLATPPAVDTTTGTALASVSDLKTALGRAKPHIPKRGGCLAVLSTVRLTADVDGATMTASDLDSTARFPVALQADGPLDVLIPFTLFSQYLAKRAAKAAPRPGDRRSLRARA